MGALWAPRNFDLGNHLLGLGTQAKTLGSPKGSLKFSLEHSIEDIKKKKQKKKKGIEETGQEQHDGTEIREQSRAQVKQ